MFAVEKCLKNRGAARVPVMISGTITDASGRTLSGQTAEAFWNSATSAQPISGPQLRARRRRTCASTWKLAASATPCVGPPQRRPAQPLSPTGYDETPEQLAARSSNGPAAGW